MRLRADVVDDVVFRVETLLLRQHGRDAHAGVAEAVEDVDVTELGAGGLGYGLQHGVDEAWDDLVDLGEEEGEEARVAVAEGGEEGEELREVVAGTRDEGIGRGRED